MKKNLGMLTLIMAFWFTISFITNILGPLIPDIIHNFNLSDLAMAGFIPTSFSWPMLSCLSLPDCSSTVSVKSRYYSVDF